MPIEHECYYCGGDEACPTLDRESSSKCRNCDRAYRKGENTICNSVFHNCRDCKWTNGRVVSACFDCGVKYGAPDAATVRADKAEKANRETTEMYALCRERREALAKEVFFLTKERDVALALVEHFRLQLENNK